MGRTGTNSLREAFNTLGFRTMHMFEILEGSDNKVVGKAWGKFVETPGVLNSKLEDLPQAAVDELLEFHGKIGFNASVDWPICNLYLHQMRRDPDAKLVLTLRSSAETWSESFMDTIATATKITSRFPVTLMMPPSFSRLSTWMYESVGMTLDKETLMPTNAVEAYNAWTARVKATVPPEKLLVHEAKDGWKPLCDFLGVPVPEGPYPRAKNDREFMIKMFAGLDFLGKYFAPIFVALLVVLVAIGVCLARCCCPGDKEKRN